MNNLFSDIPAFQADELIEVLADSGAVRIERIVSRGHVTPDAQWYDQARDEFVVLLSGAARLRFEDGRIDELAPGDWRIIPAHRRHRVEWTLENTETVWLAVHYDQE